MACFIQTILQNRPKYFRRWKYVPQICPVWNHQNQLILSLFQWKKLVLSARIRLNKKKMISKNLHFTTVEDTIFHSFYNFGLKIPLNTTKLPKIDLQALKNVLPNNFKWIMAKWYKSKILVILDFFYSRWKQCELPCYSS